MTRPLFSIVVATLPQREKILLRCLGSIERSHYQTRETILVVNGVDFPFAARVRKNYPWVKIIQLPENTGVFAFNIGICNSRGKYILMLDDDAELQSDTLQQFSEVFRIIKERIAIVSPRAYNPLTQQYYLPPVETPEGQISFHGVSAFRREIFEKIGYFDKDFFMQVWEDDYALRVLDAGHGIYYGKRIKIKHYSKEKELRAQNIYYNARNKVWLNLKHFSLFFLPLLILRDLVWLVLLVYRKRSLAALLYGVKGYLTGWLSCGKALQKRKVVNKQLQKKFLRYYLLGDVI